MSIWNTFTTLSTGGLSVVYKYAAIAGAVLALCVSSYFYGHHQGVLVSKVAIAQFQATKEQEVTDLLGLQLPTNTKIVTEYVTTEVHIHDKASNIQQQIANLPPSVVLPPAWVVLYNASLTPDSVSSRTNETPSTSTGVEANSALSTIAENDSTCLIYKARAESLMEFETDTQANIAAANGKKHR